MGFSLTMLAHDLRDAFSDQGAKRALEDAAPSRQYPPALGEGRNAVEEGGMIN
jgi:hypothetical protein